MSASDKPLLDDEKSPSIDFIKVFNKIKSYWLMSLLSALFLTTIAFVLVYRISPVYKIVASVLVQDKDKKSIGGNGNVLQSLQKMGLMDAVSNVNNEQLILSSYPLVEEVIKSKYLNFVFSTERNFKEIPLYFNTLPFEITFTNINYGKLDSIDKEERLFEIALTPSYYEIKSLDKTAKVSWGVPLNLGFGTITLTPNEKTSTWNTKNYVTLIAKSLTTVTESYLRNYTAEIANKQSSIIMLSFQNSVPARGVDFLNTLIQVYQKSTVDDYNQINDSTYNFVEQRLVLVGTELDSIEQVIAQFKQEKKLTDITLQSAALIDNLGKQDYDLSSQMVQLSVVESLIDYMRKNYNNPKVIPASLVVNNPSITQSIINYNQLLQQRERLMLSSTKENPILKNVDEQLSGLQQGIYAGLESIKMTLNTGIQKMEQRNAFLNGMVHTAPSIEQTYGEYARQQLIKKELYMFLLQKREESLIAKSSTLSNSRIIEAARVIKDPISPKKKIILVAVALLGLLLPFGVSYLFELLNTKIGTKKEIEDRTGLPIIGEIGHNNSTKTLVVARSSRSLITEQYRALMTNLHFLFSHQNDKVILFTSSISGEGKTSVAINLATMYSLNDKKVVLLEFDLRKPKVLADLGLIPNIGFTEYAIGQANFDEIIMPSGINNNLSIIPAGTLPPNPSELILHPRTSELFAYLRSQFDIIIIDAPPSVVSDAQLLSSHADLTLFMVRLNYTTKEHLSKINSIAKANKLPRLNLIANDIYLKGSNSGYHTYDYGYGQGYGNYIEEDKEEMKSSFWKRFLRFRK